jgi:hypothetical protein
MNFLIQYHYTVSASKILLTERTGKQKVIKWLSTIMEGRMVLHGERDLQIS